MHGERIKIKTLLCLRGKYWRKYLSQLRKHNGIWRIKTNKEVDELIKHRNIINYVKTQGLSWFGQTNRMPETSIVKRIHKRKPFTGRPAGRSKSRWEDDVRNDLKWSGQNKYRTAWNGRVLSRRPRLYQSCSAIEEEKKRRLKHVADLN